MAVKGNCLVPEGRLNKLLQKKLLLLVVWLGSEIDLFDLWGISESWSKSTVYADEEAWESLDQSGCIGPIDNPREHPTGPVGGEASKGLISFIARLGKGANETRTKITLWIGYLGNAKVDSPNGRKTLFFWLGPDPIWCFTNQGQNVITKWSHIRWSRLKVRLACVKHAASLHPEPGFHSCITYSFLVRRQSWFGIVFYSKA